MNNVMTQHFTHFVLILSLCLSSNALGQSSIESEHVRVEALGKMGRYTGFRVSSNRQNVATITFGSLENILASKVEAAKTDNEQTLRFTGLLSRPTPRLGEGSYIVIKITRGQSYPQVSFRLELQDFSEEEWVAPMGGVPFHFLCCSLKGAEIFHHGGWSIPTPAIDPYPLHNEGKGYGQQIASRWSRDWTYAPPMGACPIATVGLWKPTEKRYVGYDFHAARFTDHSEKTIGACYVWKHKGAEQFVTLVWPYARPYQTLRYPKTDTGETRAPKTNTALPKTVESRFHILYNLDMAGDGSPNLFVTDFVWRNFRDLLPSVPTMNDLSWLRQRRLVQLGNHAATRQNIGRLYHRVVKPRWFKAGSLVANGIASDGDSITHAYETHQTGSIARLKEDIAFLLGRAKRMAIDGDECYFWTRPLEGDRVNMFGSDSPTTHNIQGWQIALTLLDVCRNEPALRDKLMPYVDGALRYTKHILYTRGGRDDLPSPQSCLGAGPATTFCLRYYYTFRGDRRRAPLAKLALKLARTMLYRYMAVWIGDNDEQDELDSSFLVEPNAGITSLGAAGSEDVWAVLQATLNVYLATGDSILGYFLRGMLWRLDDLLEADADCPSLARVGLFDGAALPKGTCKIEKRARRDAEGKKVHHSPRSLSYPILQCPSATVHVFCGARAAIAFNTDGAHTDVAEYRCNGEGDFSFRFTPLISRPKQQTPFSATVTYPFFDLRGKATFVIRSGGSGTQKLTPDKDFKILPDRPDSLYVTGLHYGDILVIGRYDPSARIIDISIPKSDSSRLEDSAFSRRHGSRFKRLAEQTPADGLRELGSIIEPFSGHIAVLPDPYQRDLRGLAIIRMLKRAGLARRLALLTPEEFVDPSFFNAECFPLALYLAGEVYYQTIKEQNDGDEALVRYLEQGGNLMVLPRGPFPFYYNEKGKVTGSVSKFGIPICGAGVANAAERLKGVSFGGFTVPTEGRKFTFFLNPNQEAITSLPFVAGRFPFPTDAAIDRRWRPIVNAPPEGSRYVPIITLRDDGGRSYAEGAALIEHYKGRFAGARVLYVWCSLLDISDFRARIVGDAFRYLLSKITPPAAHLASTGDLRRDDFSEYKDGSDGSPNWKITRGEWMVEGGGFVGKNCGTDAFGATGAYRGDDTWRDYRFSVRFKIESRSSDWRDGPWFGIRCNRDGDGYYLNFTDRDCQVQKISYGVSTNDRNPLAKPAWRPDNKWHTLVIEAKANLLSATLDGKPLFDVKDDAHLGLPSIRSGAIVLSARKWTKSKGDMIVRFDDVRIEELQ